jgi:hypothetical protein
MGKVVHREVIDGRMTVTTTRRTVDDGLHVESLVYEGDEAKGEPVAEWVFPFQMRYTLGDAARLAVRQTVFDTLPKPKKVIKLQPAPRVDHITDDGRELTQLPYPFYVAEDGKVDRQDFWRGDPYAVIGFQEDLARQQIDLWWDDVVKDPQSAVGKYVVTRDSRGGMGVHVIAIDSVEVIGD